MKNSQTGAALLVIVFILVVLALAGTYMLKLSFSQIQLVNYSLLTSKAKLATLSAFELTKQLNEGNQLHCQDYDYEFGKEAKALSGFTVKVSCEQKIVYPSSAPTFMALQFKASATYGHLQDRDFVAYEQSRWYVVPSKVIATKNDD
ncbi:MAG: hypothetical protein AB7V32_05640 [Candidatus Berkiella sp.]